jgi:MFS transporter, ACS family, D-galactonate transporter
VQFILSLIGGWAADDLIRKGRSPTSVRKGSIALGLALGLAIVPAGLAEDAQAALLLFLTALAGMGIASANIFAVTPAIAPRGSSGLVGAIQNSAGALGGVVAPIVTGALYDQLHSFTAALFAAGGMLAVSGFGYLILLRRIEPMKLNPGVPAGAVVR